MSRLLYNAAFTIVGVAIVYVLLAALSNVSPNFWVYFTLVALGAKALAGSIYLEVRNFNRRE